MKIEGGQWEDFDLIDPKTGIPIAEIDFVSVDDADGSMVLCFRLQEGGQSYYTLQEQPDSEEMLQVRAEGGRFKVVPKVKKPRLMDA